MTLKQYYRNLYIKYVTYKDSPYFGMSLSIFCLVISVLVILLVIVPQLQNFFSVREEIESTRERIATMNDNIAFLTGLNPDVLDRDYDTATTAIPPVRDASKLLSAIASAANASGVQLEDFSFNVGQVIVSDGAAGLEHEEERSTITFGVKGNQSQVISLIDELHKKIPLLSVIKVDAQFTESDLSQVTVVYHTKSLPQVAEDPSQAIRPLTEQNRALLDNLQSWNPIGATFPEISGDSSIPF